MDSEDLWPVFSECQSDDERDDDVETHANDKLTTSTSRKRKCPPRDQPFVDNWLEIPEFKDWRLAKKKLSGKKIKPYCKLCEKILSCSKITIKRHEISKKHREKVNNNNNNELHCQNDKSNYNCKNLVVKK